jgi:hypothetical protein
MRAWTDILEDYQRSVDLYYDPENYSGRAAHGYGYFKALAENLYIELYNQAQEISSLRQELNEIKADLL